LLAVHGWLFIAVGEIRKRFMQAGAERIADFGKAAEHMKLWGQKRTAKPVPVLRVAAPPTLGGR